MLELFAIVAGALVMWTWGVYRAGKAGGFVAGIEHEAARLRSERWLDQ